MNNNESDSSKCNFSYHHYKATLKEMKKKYKFSNFSEYSSDDIILRHDIDISLKSALKIAQLENSLGIKSTFFILFHAELYNPFNLHSTKIISEIIKLGHKIGLHYNSQFFLENKIDPTSAINKEIELMETHLKTKVEVISTHNPVIDKKNSLKLPDNVINAYDDEFILNRKYLSDSVQNWREGCVCKNYSKFDKLHILIHPIWWTESSNHRNDILQEMQIKKDNVFFSSLNSLKLSYDEYIKSL